MQNKVDYDRDNNLDFMIIAYLLVAGRWLGNYMVDMLCDKRIFNAGAN